MKKFLGIVLAFVGLLLTAAGIAGIVLIGSDDTVNSPTTTIKLGEAKSVVSTPGLLAFKDTTMRLSAKSTGGAVFIGQAHPIDAKSYLADTPVYAVTEVGTSGMRGEVVKGDVEAALADPTKQTFWTTRASGAGTQSLSLKLDGTPTQYVVMPIGKGGDLTVTSGVVIKNGFALSIAALVLGLLGVTGGLWIMRRRRNSTVRAVAGPLADPTTATVDGQTRSRTMTRMVCIVAMGATVPALAGCGTVPTKVDVWTTSELTKPALASQAEAAAATKDYDVRNNAAITASATRYDTKLWAEADVDSVLATDLFSTQLQRIRKVKEKPVPGVSTPVKVYSAAFADYPMQSLVEVSETFGTKKPVTHLIALRKERATSPWLKAATVPVGPTSLPRAAAFGEASTLDKPAAAAVAKAVSQLTAQINTGKGGPTLPKELSTYLADQRDMSTFLKRADLTAALWNPTAEDQLAPGGSIQAAKAEQGSVVLVQYRLSGNYEAKPGMVIEFQDKDFAAVTAQAGQREAIRYRATLSVAMLLDAAGKPSVIGHDISRLV